MRPVNELEDLKRLILGEEKESLEDLQERVQDPQSRALDVADVLAESVRSNAKNKRFVDALREPVGECIRRAVKNDTGMFADALYPVMGPAIRRSIQEALQSFTQSLQQVIEHSTSPKSLRWRVEAWRSGVPFSEILLQKTLVYRIEQAFLIHRETGLSMGHAAHLDVITQDTDAVSGMLTAIQDFVRDSFAKDATDRGGNLESVQVGEQTVWIMSREDAMLACVIRGVAPLELREELGEVLNEIHRQFGDKIDRFSGAPSDMIGVEDVLQQCLRDQRQSGAESMVPAVLGVLVAALLAYWGLHAWSESRRVDALAQSLDDAPGIVVLELAERGGRLRVKALFDPLATPAASYAAAGGFEPGEVVFELTPFQSLAPEMVKRRAEQWLRPPPGVSLRLTAGILFASGEAPADWLEGVRALGNHIPGLGRLDLHGVRRLETDGAARERD